MVGAVGFVPTREGKNHLLCPSDHTVFDAAQDTVGFLGCKCPLLAHAEFLVNQHRQVLLILLSVCSLSSLYLCLGLPWPRCGMQMHELAAAQSREHVASSIAGCSTSLLQGTTGLLLTCIAPWSNSCVTWKSGMGYFTNSMRFLINRCNRRT